MSATGSEEQTQQAAETEVVAAAPEGVPTPEVTPEAELDAALSDVPKGEEIPQPVEEEPAPRFVAPKRPEMSVAAFIRLLRLPSVDQIVLLQSQVEAQAQLIEMLSVKLDAISSQLQANSSGANLERLEYQLGEIRTALKAKAAKGDSKE